MFNGLHYGPLDGDGPMGQPAYLKSTAYAPQAPYVGAELAQLTSMTPFMAGDFVPVRVMRRSIPAYDGFLDNLRERLQQRKAKRSDTGGYAVALGLSKGMKGSDVGELQSALVDLGFPPSRYGATQDIDDDFGGATEKALKAFQAAYGLPQTGMTDQKTVAKIADPQGILSGRDQQKAETKAAAGAAVADVLKAAFIPKVAEPSGQYVIQQKNTTPWGLIAVGGILTVAILGGVIAATR
jgi:hypothetical protein